MTESSITEALWKAFMVRHLPVHVTNTVTYKEVRYRHPGDCPILKQNPDGTTGIHVVQCIVC